MIFLANRCVNVILVSWRLSVTVWDPSMKFSLANALTFQWGFKIKVNYVALRTDIQMNSGSNCWLISLTNLSIVLLNRQSSPTEPLTSLSCNPHMANKANYKSPILQFRKGKSDAKSYANWPAILKFSLSRPLSNGVVKSVEVFRTDPSD